MIDIDDVKTGDRVIYVPAYAHGNIVHPDCQRGAVVGRSTGYVFVCYDDETHAKATRPEDLVKE